MEPDVESDKSREGTTRKCPFCAEEIQAQALKCKHCGEWLRRVQLYKEVPRRKTSRTTILFVVLIAVIIIAYAMEEPKGTQSDLSNHKSPKEIALASVKLDYSWKKAGFDNVMEADFTVINNSQYDIKDFEIRCEHYSKSGSKIDSNTRTIYDIVKANSKKTFKNFNMGFIHSQAESSSCRIADLKI